MFKELNAFGVALAIGFLIYVPSCSVMEVIKMYKENFDSECSSSREDN